MSTGWSVRNFIYTGIVEKLLKDFHLIIITSPNLIDKLASLHHLNGVKLIALSSNHEPIRWRLFRQIKKKIYMEGRRSSTEQIWEKYVKRPYYQKIGSFIIKQILKIIKYDYLLMLVENIDHKLNSDKLTKELFIQYKPEMFFATHATTYFEERLLHSAVALRIPVVFMVLSWDHLSSKVVLSNKYKYIFVWNSITQQEILETSDVYEKNQIRVVGVPQYDIYYDKPKLSYNEWCQKYDLSSAKKTLLFSTMPQIRHNQQHVIIEAILKNIEQGKDLPVDLQVLIKCHPFDDVSKYEYLLTGKYPVGILKTTLPPGVHPDNWFPAENEMEISRDALYYCAININIFSTVTLEAAYLDKPVIHIAFDPYPVKNRIPCKEYYNFEHFRKITLMNASILVYSFKDLYQAINQYLMNVNINSEQRKNLVNFYFAQDITSASDAVVANLIMIKNELS
jgi:hypothetical protein